MREKGGFDIYILCCFTFGWLAGSLVERQYHGQNGTKMKSASIETYVSLQRQKIENERQNIKIEERLLFYVCIAFRPNYF